MKHQMSRGTLLTVAVIVAGFVLVFWALFSAVLMEAVR